MEIHYQFSLHVFCRMSQIILHNFHFFLVKKGMKAEFMALKRDLGQSFSSFDNSGKTHFSVSSAALINITVYSMDLYLKLFVIYTSEISSASSNIFHRY